jgi:2-oxo-4-hydroxy-4-carboxy--5-ureidoimidazoline (OHCU) decarboxylase
MRYQFIVEIDADNKDHAMQVMAERLGYDEQYEDDAGVEFAYQIADWRYFRRLDDI